MPALLPILVTGAHLVLVADKVPVLNYETSCRAAVEAAVAPNRNESACVNDEKQARAKLEQDWSKYTPSQREHCTSLSRTGGPPSYVELLTCVELSEAAAALPDHGTTPNGRIER